MLKRNLKYYPHAVWYIGTEPELGDILPKTEVSFNDSSRAEIQGGTLYLNGASFANVSEIIAAHYGELASIFFEFEPGRLVYNTLELCNFVHRCVAVETHPSILISESCAYLLTQAT